MESGGKSEKEATAAEITLRAIIKMKIGGCPLFCNSSKAGIYQHSQSEGVAWHRKDDILRGLGMCLQQVKRTHVRTMALLANLRSNND